MNFNDFRRLEVIDMIVYLRTEVGADIINHEIVEEMANENKTLRGALIELFNHYQVEDEDGYTNA